MPTPEMLALQKWIVRRLTPFYYAFIKSPLPLESRLFIMMMMLLCLIVAAICIVIIAALLFFVYMFVTHYSF